MGVLDQTENFTISYGHESLTNVTTSLSHGIFSRVALLVVFALANFGLSYLGKSRRGFLLSDVRIIGVSWKAKCPAGTDKVAEAKWTASECRKWLGNLFYLACGRE